MTAGSHLAALLAVGLALVAGCRPKSPVAPDRAHRLNSRSVELADADLVVAALNAADFQRLRDWMTPELRARVDIATIEEGAFRLRRAFGPPQGVLEERTHREGSLQWYSGIWVHLRKERNPVLTPVLYQFALDDKRRLARLLVREHWFIENVQSPADAYQPVTRLHFMGRGEWTISQGGRSKALNKHFGLGPQRFAYDIIMKKNGRRRRPGSNEKDNSSYYCYGQPVFAPAAGTIVKAVNNVPENVPGTRGKAGGNGVVIDHGFGEYSAIWHGIPGSVAVKVGDRVEVGQPIMRAGNSGRSTGPHIHYDLHNRFRPGNTAVGLPAPFVDVWVDGVWRESAEPARGQTIRVDAPKGAIALTRRVFIDM